MSADKRTKSEQVNADLTALLKARNSLLWIVTREEARVERAIVEASAAARYLTRFWDCATGISEASNEPLNPNLRDPNAALAWLTGATERQVLVMRDLHKWLDPVVLRGVRTLARSLQSRPTDNATAIVILTPSAEVPPELAGHATVIDYPLPERKEIGALLDLVIASLPDAIRGGAIGENGARERAIDAAVGLTAEEASNCYARSLVTTKSIDAVLVAKEKRMVIARERVLTWTDPDPRGVDAIGGLELLKDWLAARRLGFGAKARAFGLPAPKGVMLVGVPGCGKSLTVKCVAAAWGVPLLRLDMGALRSKYVGESEGNIRKALRVAETVAPCVLWLDEIEKALAGSTGAQGDGGVSADALGAVLSWMQDREGDVFVVATANDVTNLPPELLRKGRFDDLFFVDLPTPAERIAIVLASVKQYGRELSSGDARTVAKLTDGFTGSEIAALVPDALFAAFADGERAIEVDDIVAAVASVVPLAKTAAEKIDALRKWAVGRCRPASRVLLTPAAPTGGRQVEV